MNPNTSLNVRWPALVVAAALLLATGAGATYFILRQGSASHVESGHTAPARTPPSGDSPAKSTSMPESGAALPDVVVTLTPEAVARAGITIAPVGTSRAAAGLRLPG